jgi:glutathione reductase (NADPH)
MKSFNLAVIGSGAAAQTVAKAGRESGWSVAVIDKRPFGGTCVLRGCVPKKVLMQAAATVDAARRHAGAGFSGRADLDWARLMAFKRTFTEPAPAAREKALRDIGIETFHGQAVFSGRGSLSIGDEQIEARHIVIAAGSEPVALDVPGAELIATSDDFLDLASLPRSIVLVGGGYIGFEFAHIAARAGAHVTVLQRGPRVLTGFDPDLVDRLVHRSRATGIDVRMDVALRGVERSGHALRCHVASGVGDSTLDADLVVNAAGRQPPLAALRLESAGVTLQDGRLRLNKFLQSVSNPAVYAAGDAAASGPAVTPVASHDGAVVAANLLEGNVREADYGPVPRVLFSIPPLAAVGMSEQEARRNGHPVDIKHEATEGWFSSRVEHETASAFKTIVDRDTGRILGAHILGPEAPETINLFAVAIRHGIVAAELRDIPFAFPTAASDIASMV